MKHSFHSVDFIRQFNLKGTVFSALECLLKICERKKTETGAKIEGHF